MQRAVCVFFVILCIVNFAAVACVWCVTVSVCLTVCGVLLFQSVLCDEFVTFVCKTDGDGLKHIRNDVNFSHLNLWI